SPHTPESEKKYPTTGNRRSSSRPITGIPAARLSCRDSMPAPAAPRDQANSNLLVGKPRPTAALGAHPGDSRRAPAPLGLLSMTQQRDHGSAQRKNTLGESANGIPGWKTGPYFGGQGLSFDSGYQPEAPARGRGYVPPSLALRANEDLSPVKGSRKKRVL